MSHRKEATQFLLEMIDKFLPGSENKAIYEERLKSMSDDDFERFVTAIENGEETLVLFAPNGIKPALSVERNFAIADELGHEFFHVMTLTDPDTGLVYDTNEKYLVVHLPVRRQAQMLVKKVSIPENDQHVDQLTDQPTGPSKGAKLSFPELQILYAQGADRIIEELIKFRGGDTKAYQNMKNLLMTEGAVSQDAIKQLNTRVKSTEVLSTILKAMHLNNNL